MNITKEQMGKLLKVLAFWDAKTSALDELLGDAFGEYFGHEWSEMLDVILDVCSIPPEDTPLEEYTDDTFVRDHWLEQALDLREKVDVAQDSDKVSDAEFVAVIEEWTTDGRVLSGEEEESPESGGL
jgi:hypothetical protein